MSTKWLVFLLSLWVILAGLGGVIEQGFYGAQEETPLEILMSPGLFTSIDEAGEVTSTSVFSATYIGSLVKVATFDFIMFQDTSYGQMLHWMLFLPIGLAMIITFGLALFRGVGST